MKKVLLIAAAVMLIASSVSATGYIGIYKDLARAYNYVNCNVGSVTGYIWCLPPAEGIIAAEFAVSFPPPPAGGYSTVAVAPNPLLSGAAIGTLETGVSCVFMACQTSWVYTHKFTLYNYDEFDEQVFFTVPGQVKIIPHPVVGVYQFDTCVDFDPLVPFVYLTPLYVCSTLHPLGVQEKNWGAIKSLF